MSQQLGFTAIQTHEIIKLNNYPYSFQLSFILQVKDLKLHKKNSPAFLSFHISNLPADSKHSDAATLLKHVLKEVLNNLTMIHLSVHAVLLTIIYIV